MANRTAPLGQKLAWGMGGFADFVASNTIVILASPIYNIGLGVSAVLVGLAIGLPRIFDAVTDPFMGNISDNTRTRWGRRRPYIFVGAIFSGIVYATVWLSPESLGKTGLFVYLLTTSMVFFLAYTIFVVPHTALGFEMSPDPHERTRILAFRTFFQALATLLTPWIYWLSLRPLFGNNEVVGMRYVGVLVGVVIALTGVAPAIFCRENMAVQVQRRIAFSAAVRHTVSSRAFLAVTGILLITLTAYNIIGPFGMYISIYHVCDGDKDFASRLFGLGSTIGAVSAIAALWPITRISALLGKKACLFVGEVIVLLAFGLSFVVYTPSYPYLQLVSTALAGLGLQWVCLIVLSMISDCCDQDEVRTGLRREGMYQAMFGFAVKGAIGAAGSLSGFMLALSGYDPEVIPSEGVVLKMRLLYAFVPAAFVLIAMLLDYLYPLNDRKMREIRDVLDARRGEVAAGSSEWEPLPALQPES